MADEYDEHGLPLWPAAERNKQPILDQLLELLPEEGGLFLAFGTDAQQFHEGAPGVSKFRPLLSGGRRGAQLPLLREKRGWALLGVWKRPV